MSDEEDIDDIQHGFLSKPWITTQRQNQWIVILLLEIFDEVERHHTFRLALKRAVKALVDHPHIINTRTDSLNVLGIGPKIAGDIETGRAMKHLYTAKVQPYIEQHNKDKSKNKNNKNKKKKKTRKNKQDKPDENGYQPRHGTGNWAILYAMTNAVEERIDLNLALTRDELITKAQPFCKDSFRHENSDSWYTAWSNHGRLIKAHYVTEENRGRRPSLYRLTKLGYNIGQKIIKQHLHQRNNVVGESTHLTGIQPSLKRNNPPLADITNLSSPPPIKRRRLNKSPSTPQRERFFGKHEMEIIDGLDEKYDLKEPILIDGKKYKLYLNVDTRESVENNETSTAIDIFAALSGDIQRKVLCKNETLSGGDFAWFLQNIEDDGDVKVLPFLIERKTWGDLSKSISDGRYVSQKKVLSFAASSVVHGGRKIYLIEGELHKNVPQTKRRSCKQAATSTESRDQYFVIYTKTKRETLRKLVAMTYLIRQWMDGKAVYNNVHGYVPDDDDRDLFKFGSLLQYEDLNDVLAATHRANCIEISQRHFFMKSLCEIPDVDAHLSWYITKKYSTFKSLWNAWKDCDDIKEAKMLLHDEIIIQPYWKFIEEITSTKYQECNKPDDDIMNVLQFCKNNNENQDNERECIGEELSETIWNTYCSDKVQNLNKEDDKIISN